MKKLKELHDGKGSDSRKESPSKLSDSSFGLAKDLK